MDPTNLPKIDLSSVLRTSDSAASEWTQIVETLVSSDKADSVLIKGIVSKVPDIVTKWSAALCERVALKYLEEWLDSQPPLSRSGDGKDVDGSGDVLLSLLEKEAAVGGLQKKEIELFRHELCQYVLKKRSSLSTCFIDQLEGSGNRDSSRNQSYQEKHAMPGTGLGVSHGLHFFHQQSSDGQNGQNGGDRLNGEKGNSDITDNQHQLLEKDSAAHSFDANNSVLEKHPCESDGRLHQPTDDKIEQPNQNLVVLSAGNGKEMLQEDPCEYGQHDQLRQKKIDQKLKSVKHSSRNHTVERDETISSVHMDTNKQNSATQLPCKKSKKKQDDHAFASRMMLHSSNNRGEVDETELRISNIAGDVGRCNDISFGNQQMPTNEISQSFTEDGMTENDLCIRCARGGLLLHCGSGSCSFSVHESCIAPYITSDENDCFICPTCSFNRAAASYVRMKYQYTQVKKSYLQAKEALEFFLSKPSKQQSTKDLSNSGGLRITKDKQGKNMRKQKNKTSNVGMIGKSYQSIEQSGKAMRTPTDVNFASERADLAAQEQLSKVNSTPAVDIAMSSKTKSDEENNLKVRFDVENAIVNNHPKKLLTSADNIDDVISKSREDTVTEQHIPESIGTLEDVDVANKEAGTVNGCQRAALLTDEGCQNMSVADMLMRQGATRAKNGDLACNTSKPEVTCSTMEANMKCKGTLVEPQTMQKRKQPKFLIDQFAFNRSEENAIDILTNGRCAKKIKLAVQTDNVIKDSRKHLAEDMPAPSNSNAACEEGEPSAVREMCVVSDEYPNNRSKLIGSDMEKKTHKDHSVTDILPSSNQEPITTVVLKNREDAVVTRPKLSYRDEQNCDSSLNNWPSNKRDKHFWTPEEEKALWEAMQKVSLNEKGCIPWTMIWGMISHVFREPRQPGDLKIKWRNMKSKESRTRKG